MINAEKDFSRRKAQSMHISNTWRLSSSVFDIWNDKHWSESIIDSKWSVKTGPSLDRIKLDTINLNYFQANFAIWRDYSWVKFCIFKHNWPNWNKLNGKIIYQFLLKKVRTRALYSLNQSESGISSVRGRVIFFLAVCFLREKKTGEFGGFPAREK